MLHTIIMSTLLQFSPDEAQLYLVDFKEGVEFKTYSKLNLPSIRVVAIDCEREFGLNILKELQKEMKRRYDVFKREADREDISDYRKVRGVKMPKSHSSICGETSSATAVSPAFPFWTGDAT